MDIEWLRLKVKTLTNTIIKEARYTIIEKCFVIEKLIKQTTTANAFQSCCLFFFSKNIGDIVIFRYNKEWALVIMEVVSQILCKRLTGVEQG